MPKMPARASALLAVVEPGIECTGGLAQGVEPSGRIAERIVGRILVVEMLASEAQTSLAGQAPVEVDHAAADLGVVGPRAPVEVVGPDGHPRVVDDADLRVHI